MAQVTRRIFKGKWGWVVFWILLFWPIAIVYWWQNTQAVTEEIKD